MRAKTIAIIILRAFDLFRVFSILDLVCVIVEILYYANIGSKYRKRGLSLIVLSVYALKRLLNHKLNNDVTAGYIIMDVERLRLPMQRITDYILNCIDIKQTVLVIPIKLSL